MAASAKSLQNITVTGIFNPGAPGVNVGDASAALAYPGLGKVRVHANPACNRSAQLPECRSNLGSIQISSRSALPLLSPTSARLEDGSHLSL
jgi:hypothetical protein